MKEIEKTKKKISYFRNPFNYCDHRCEKCSLIDKCEIYQKSFSQRLSHIIKDEDPDDPMVFFSDLKDNFKNIVELIKKEIKKYGLDPKKMEIKISKNSFYQEFNFKKIPIWQKSQEFKTELNSLLEDIFTQEDEEIRDIFFKKQEIVEELDWYNNFFSEVLTRALAIKKFSLIKKEDSLTKIQEKEMNISARLSFQSLEKCQKILKNDFLEFSGYLNWIENLIIKNRSILEEIETKFPDSYKEMTIFHG